MKIVKDKVDRAGKPTELLTLVLTVIAALPQNLVKNQHYVRVCGLCECMSMVFGSVDYVSVDWECMICGSVNLDSKTNWPCAIHPNTDFHPNTNPSTDFHPTLKPF